MSGDVRSCGNGPPVKTTHATDERVGVGTKTEAFTVARSRVETGPRTTSGAPVNSASQVEGCVIWVWVIGGRGEQIFCLRILGFLMCEFGHRGILLAKLRN